MMEDDDAADRVRGRGVGPRSVQGVHPSTTMYNDNPYLVIDLNI